MIITVRHNKALGLFMAMVPEMREDVLRLTATGRNAVAGDVIRWERRVKSTGWHVVAVADTEEGARDKAERLLTRKNEG